MCDDEQLAQNEGEPPAGHAAWAERLGVRIIDDFHANAEAVRARALEAEYAQPGHAGAGPARRCPCSDELCHELDAALARHLGRAVRTNLANFRYTTEDAVQALACHTDWDLGDATAVVYLTRPEHCRGGTAFFRHRATGDLELRPEHAERYDYRERDAWELLFRAPMAFNRCVVFPAQRFHAVVPPLFGRSIVDGRLTQVSWFNFGTRQSDYVATLPR